MIDIYTSTAADGSMKSTDGSFASVLPTRTAFLTNCGLRPENTTLVHLTYGAPHYTRYQTVDSSLAGDGITRAPSFEADGVVTKTSGLALFLPLADCIGTVLHDPVKKVLMVSHLGRHNLEESGGTRSVQYLRDQFDCDPKDITIWLSPAAGKDNYPLFAFAGRSMHDVAAEQLIAAGVPPENITTSPIDVTTDPDYFSHSEFLKGNRETDGRFAIVAVMQP